MLTVLVHEAVTAGGLCVPQEPVSSQGLCASPSYHLHNLAKHQNEREGESTCTHPRENGKFKLAAARRVWSVTAVYGASAAPMAQYAP
jgi:hypothetical protein